MTREEMADLTEFIAICCPQQKIGRATAVAWYEVIGHLDFEAARNAVIAVKHSQAFVDPSDILAEAQRKDAAKPYDRSAAEALAGPAELAELMAAPRRPAPPEFSDALRGLRDKIRVRTEQALAVDREAGRRAQAWIEYKLSGQLPPHMPLSAPPSPRWVQLPGDPPELRAWLARQTGPEPAGPS